MYSIAIDLGGTIIKIGLMQADEILDSICFASKSGGLTKNLPLMEDAVNGLLSKRNIRKEELCGVGLAFPGMVNPEEKKVTSTNEKYNDACNIDLVQWAYLNWEASFVIGNDARLAVLGEWRFGAGKGYRNLVMMTLGTGIGTGVILDGKQINGKHFQAGSLGGHMIVDYRGRRCTCGNLGCVEAMASSFFLPEIIRSHPHISEEQKAKAISFDFKDLFSLMKQGDAGATLLCTECMDVWSAAIVNYIHAYDPEVIVLGGGIMKSGDVIIPHVRKRIDQLVWCPQSKKVEIKQSVLGDHAALFGISYTLSILRKEKYCEQLY